MRVSQMFATEITRRIPGTELNSLGELEPTSAIHATVRFQIYQARTPPRCLSRVLSLLISAPRTGRALASTRQRKIDELNCMSAIASTQCLTRIADPGDVLAVTWRVCLALLNRAIECPRLGHFE